MNKKWIFTVLLLIISGTLTFILTLKSCLLSKDKEVPVFTSKVELSMNSEMIKKVVLKNGLTVLAFRNSTTPKVLLQIAYDIGSWVEEGGEKGLAHLIEHMIFKGTDKLSEGDIDAISRKYGATYNAFTSKDMTSYYFEVNKNNWKPFISILADCMQNARFEEQHLSSELRAVVQELKMYKDSHWNVMLEEASRLVYPSNYSYHFPIIGYKEDLVNSSAANLKKFYKKYYRPERAYLFIVGDIDINESVEYAKQNFENINGDDGHKFKKEALLKEKFPAFSKGTTSYRTTMHEEVQKENLGFYWTIPGLKNNNEILVSVIEFILGQSEGSRLYRRLVDEEKVASSVMVMADQLMESGLFLILAEPVDGKSEQCRKIVIEELEKLKKEGVSPTELSKVIRNRGREFFQELQSLQGFTYEWMRSYITTQDEFDVFEKIKAFNKIDSKQIQDFVCDYLDPFFMNQIELLPLPEDKKSVWLKEKEESERVDEEILSKHHRTAVVEKPKYVETLPEPKSLDFSYPKPDARFVLDNGMVVILKKNGQWPIISFNCALRDATFLGESKDGVLLEFMSSSLIEGSEGFSKKENVDFFENAGTTYSFFGGGSLVLLNTEYEKIFERFLHILTKPEFSNEPINKLKDIFIDLYTRRKDSPADLAVKLLKNEIYKNHPYCWTFDQAIELIKNVNISQLKALHKKYIAPQNMVLTVVGNFDLNEMQQTLTKIFGQWKGGRYQKIEYPKSEFSPIKIDQYMLRDQAVLLFGRPSPIDIYHSDLIPLKLLNSISFESLGSRLFQLREQTGLFYTAFGSFAAGASKIPGFDYEGAILSIENVEKAEKMLLDVVDKVGKDGVKKDELEAARLVYLKRLIDYTASNEAITILLGSLESFDLGFDYYDRVLKRVQTIPLEELNKIANKYFVSNGMARIRVGRIGKKA